MKLQNRMEIEPLIKEPTMLTFVTTEKCSSACSSCCFQCSPKRSKKLTKEQMVGYIEIQNFLMTIGALLIQDIFIINGD